MPKSTWKGYVKKQAKRAYNYGKKYAKKRYTTKRGNINTAQIIKDVAMLKSVINAEKKYIDTGSLNTVYPLAQLNGAGISGAQALLPMNAMNISQGNGVSQRSGDSLKVSSMCFKFHVESNSFFTLQPTKYTFYLLRQPQNPVAGGSALSQFLEANPFSGVIDYYSQRDIRNYRDWIVIGKVSGTLKANTNNSSNQYQTNSHMIAKKCNFHIRYEPSTNTIISNQIYLLCVASDGDRSGTNLINFQYHAKLFYYDN